MKYYIGIDIGGTKCALTAAPTDGEIIMKKSFATNVSRGWKAIVAEILDTFEALLNDCGIQAADVAAAGISCGGPLDSKRGTVQCPPNLPDWDNVPITSLVTERFGCPAFLQNDANACAVAEWKYGAGKGTNNMIFLTFGTGMGAGLILNGRLYSGTNDMAGEVGHIRLAEDGPVGYGKAGSFEGFCSGGGIARYAAARAKEFLEQGGKTSVCADIDEADKITAKDLAIAAQNGDAFSLGMYEDVGRNLGKGLSVLIDILNPECIVIGSIFARSEALIRPAMEMVLKKECLCYALEKCRVVPAALGESIGDYAALGVAQIGLEEQ